MVEQTADILAEERLQDPLNDRVVPLNVLKMPPQRPLAYERVYTKGNDNPNLDLVKQYLMEGGSFSKELIRQTVGRAGAIMLKELRLLQKNYYCLLTVFNLCQISLEKSAGD